eukprot:CAMPEP_0170635866 /NCGR_PEP_ID=MMETSP0224-20130122/37461_1 /TAXON_ID=285029 /ORGANISM="Togula jolla, Strain CCCM 725" /LENGTH=197 /DNA_ID=CAMNT_0010965417 /DNA_START=104 /DNA_END=698 /DNA_ORIENTATION=-
MSKATPGPLKGHHAWHHEAQCHAQILEAEGDDKDLCRLPWLACGEVQRAIVAEPHADEEGQGIAEHIDHHHPAHAQACPYSILDASTLGEDQITRVSLQLMLLPTKGHQRSNGEEALLHLTGGLRVPGLRLLLQLVPGFHQFRAPDAINGSIKVSMRVNCHPAHNEGEEVGEGDLGAGKDSEPEFLSKALQYIVHMN